MGGVHFAQLNLDAVVGVTIRGEDVELPSPDLSLLLLDQRQRSQAEAFQVFAEPVLQPAFVAAKFSQG